MWRRVEGCNGSLNLDGGGGLEVAREGGDGQVARQRLAPRPAPAVAEVDGEEGPVLEHGHVYGVRHVHLKEEEVMVG